MSQQQHTPEPFGHFKAEAFGWTDCAETDEGAQPLYDQAAIDELGERLMASDYALKDALRQRDVLLAALERIATAAGATWCNTDWIAAHAKLAIADVKGGAA